MKKLLYLFAVTAIMLSAASCKKCYNCAYSECGSCALLSGTEYCKSSSASTYDAYKAACAAAGGTWAVTTTAHSQEFCEKKNSVNITLEQGDCEDAGGVWTSK